MAKQKRIREKKNRKTDKATKSSSGQIKGLQSVNGRLTMIIVSMIVIVAAGLTTISVLMSSAGLKDTIDESMQQLSIQSANVISERLEGILDSMESFVLNRNIWNIKADEAKIKPLLKEFAELNGHSYAYIAAADGIGYTSQNNPTDIRERAYYPVALGGGTFITEPTLSVSTGQLVSLYVVPIKDESGKVIGILGAARDGMDFTRMIEGISYGKTGNAFVLGRTGTLIASDNEDLVREGFNIVNASESNDEYDSMMPQTLAMVAGETGIDRFKFLGQHMQSAYAPIGDTGWSLAVQAPIAETYASRDTMRLVLIASAVLAFLISMGLSLFFIRRISKPISETTGLIQELSLGKTDIQVSSDIKSRKDEIGLLAQAVENISESIKEKSDAATAIAAGNLAITVNPRSDEDILSLSMQSMITSLNQMIAESKRLTAAAAGGQLMTRGQADNFSGAYREIIAGINETLEVITMPMSEAQQIKN